MAVRFYLTDVFGGERYTGNQLATFVDDQGLLSSEEMQRIAREINFSETTFITGPAAIGGAFPARIFTPRAEVGFAGHPTLGAAHVIREHVLRSPVPEVTLDLKAGRIPVTFSRQPDRRGNTLLWMRQLAPRFGDARPPEWCAALLGLVPDDIDTAWPALEISTGFPHLVIPLRSLAALRRARIDRSLFGPWAKTAQANVLAFSAEPYAAGQTLAVRVFADYFGIPEDAATGSGNGCLAAYLVRTRYTGADRIDLAVGQGYELGRPSELHLRAQQGADVIEVSVGGAVVDIAQGVWGGAV